MSTDEKDLNPKFPYRLEKAHWYLLFLWMEGILTEEEFDRAMDRLTKRRLYMDDLISRKALLDAYDKAHQGPPGGARKLIEEAPEAIIRCKYCKHWFPGCELQHKPMSKDDNWYCGDGERK